MANAENLRGDVLIGPLLTTDRLRPTVIGTSYDQCSFVFPAPWIQLLNHWADSDGVTTSQIVLVAFQVLLGRYSNDSKIVVGISANDGGAEPSDSLFENAASVSIDLDDELSFRELVSRIKIEEQSSQGVNLSAEDRRYTVLFSPLGRAGSEKSLTCDIALSLAENAETIIAHFKFSLDLFLEVSIKRLCGHFETLLSALMSRYDSVVGELPLIGPDERQLLLETWNDRSDYTQTQTLHQRFENIVDADPNAAALRFLGETITYGELNECSNRVAHMLLASRLEPGAHVMNLLDSDPDQIAVMLGTLKAGGVYVCLDPQQPSFRLNMIVEETKPAALITNSAMLSLHTSLLQKINDSTIDIFILDAEVAEVATILNVVDGARVFGNSDIQECPGTNPTIAINPSARAYIAYTSGSTGRPKGIVQTHSAFCQFIEWQAKEIGIGKHERFMQWASIGYDASYCEIFGALCFGATLVLAPAYERHDPLQLSNLLRDERVTILQVVPSFARELIESLRQIRPATQTQSINLAHADTSREVYEALPDDQPLPDLRVLMLAGERLPVELARAWHSVFTNTVLYNLYGPSESVLATFHRLYPPASGERGIGIGRPIDGRQILIFDDRQRLCPIGVVGELYIRSAYLTGGYLHQPQETALRFVQNPLHDDFYDPAFRTGDRARWLADGTLEFFGRDDNLVKLNGMRVELGDVEAVLRQLPGVRDGIVLVRELAKRDKLTAKAYEAREFSNPSTPKQVLVAYFVMDDESASLGAADIREFMLQRLPKHMVPAQFVCMAQLPLNANGKVDIRELPEPGRTRPALQQPYIKPRAGLETTISELWAQTLEIDEVGAKDGFFDLGGDSLLAMQVLNKLSEVCGRRLLNRHLVENDTPARLAKFLDSPGSDLMPVRAIQKAPRRDTYPLAVAQQGLWYLWNLDPRSPFYNALGCLHLEGELDLPTLRRAWDAMIERHIVVRSRFLRRDGMAELAFDDDRVSVELPLTDLTQLPLEERQPAVAAAAKASAQRAFDLEKDPLLIANLYRTSEQRYELVVTYHEIILDLWGFAVMIRDLCSLYEDFIAGRDCSLAPIDVDFRDYLVWESQHIRRDQLAGQQKYWHDQLQGELPILELPLDRPRPRKRTFAGSARSVMLDQELSDQLRDLSQKNGTTLFKTLLAAFKLLLYTYSGQDDLIVGTPVANRAHKSIEDLVGWFINMLPIRTRFREDMTFVDLLRSIHHSVTHAISNSDVPFSWMLLDTDVQRDPSVAPVFQVMFNWQNLPHLTVDSGNLEVSSSELDSGYKKYDLALYAQEHVGQIYLHMSYLTDIFDHRTVERMLANLEVILNSIVIDPNMRLSDYDIVTGSERQMLESFSPPQKDYGIDRSIQQYFEQGVLNHPERTALIFAGKNISYAELNRRANRLSRALIEVGVNQGDRVAVCANRSFETVASVLAILKAGCAYVALDPNYPRLRLEEILSDTEPTAILLHESLDCFEKFIQPRVYLDAVDQRYANLSTENLQISGHIRDPLTVVYTSSSSGTAKGILISQDSVLNRLFWMWDAYPFRDGDVALLHKSISLVAATWELFGALLKGVPTLVMSYDEVRDPARFWDVSVQNRISHVLATPPMISAILDQARTRQHSWPTLRFATTSAEPISPEIVLRWHETFPDALLLNLYGSTECSSNASVYDTARLSADAIRVPIGKALNNVKIQVLNRNYQPLPIGAVGEMAVSGACLANGYLNLPDLNSEKFLDGPPRTCLTGDLARYLPDGNLELLGRRDRQVNVRGFRVNLDDVEHTLAAHRDIARCAVLLHGEGTSRCQLWSYAVLKPKNSTSQSQLRDFIRERLPDYMVPAQVMILDNLPLTRTGKLDYRALPSPRADRDMAGVDYIPPRNDLELQVVKLWEEILEINRVGINDDFFDLGGHSLLAVELIGLMEKKFDKQIPLVNFFQNSTPERFVKLLLEQGHTITGSAVVPLRKTGNRIPFFCICGVHLYRELADCLDDEQPIYTIFIADEIVNMGARGNTVRVEAIPSVEQQASSYVKMIREVQPSGPYYLGGLSYGGLLAFEIAQQLWASGDHVGLVAMFDSSLRGSDQRSSLRIYLAKVRNSIRQLKGKAISHAEADQFVKLRRRMFNEAGKRYQPKPARFKLGLFRAMDRPMRSVDPLKGWQPFAQAGIEVLDVPGDHTSCLQAPHVSVLGGKLNTLLKEVQVADAAR